ncbi:hypothetical protein DFH08DRAFT_276822 [Mycena albidolilacea]|uniref:Peptidase A1 domain-containing protein n=1 Tax=Mycena albidolilacea TaxID=1033008 RepID=A0AAD7APU4_9AGAR|nr:hypothetical protein DFH08DRAFT_276822 [Mycena albidolilacea]
MRSPFSLWTSCIFAWTLLSVLSVLTESKPLVPYKHTPRVLPRSTWKREIVPQDIVILPYAPEGAHRPTSSLTFSAYENVPLLALEDIEFLIETVVCDITLDKEDAMVEIVFASEDAYAMVEATWSSLSKFILVTSHSTCNPSDRRSAWMVSSVEGEDFKNAISLEVSAMPLRTIGSSFHISHASDSVSTRWRSRNAPQRQRRDVDQIIPFNQTLDFEPRQQLLPFDLSLIDSSLNDLEPDPLGLQVFCVDCVSELDFSVGLEIDISDTLSVTAAWINVTINDFHHDINLEISLDAAHTFNKGYDVLLKAIPDLGFSLHDVATIGFFWGGAIRADLTVEAAVNFTVGVSADIPKGAKATFVATDIEQSSASGWDKAKFDIHPFRLNSGSFSVTAGISLSPFLDATISFGTGAGSSARLYLNTPHISGAATLATQVNRECQPVGPDDYESFAAALTFGAGLNISLEGNVSGNHLPEADMIFLSKGLPFGPLPTFDDPKCMVITDDTLANAASAIAALLPAVTGTLLAAASAIPTFNVSGIEAFFSAHGALPTNVDYSQMLLATAVPDDIKSAVQKAAESEHKHPSKVAAIVGGVIGGVALVVIVAIGVWYLRRRRPQESETVGGWAPGSLPKTGALTPGSQLEGKDYMSQRPYAQ